MREVPGSTPGQALYFDEQRVSVKTLKTRFCYLLRKNSRLLNTSTNTALKTHHFVLTKQGKRIKMNFKMTGLENNRENSIKLTPNSSVFIRISREFVAGCPVVK